mgnify:CR=1 FL=1
MWRPKRREFVTIYSHSSSKLSINNVFQFQLLGEPRLKHQWSRDKVPFCGKKKKKSFGSSCEALVFVCCLTHLRAHAHVPSVHLPPTCASSSRRPPGTVPPQPRDCETTGPCSPPLSSGDSASQGLLLSVISPVVYSNPSTCALTMNALALPGETCREESRNVHVQKSFLIVPLELISG